MDTSGILLTVLLIVASVLCIAGVWAAVEAARASRSLKTLAQHLDAQVVPLLEKADVTIDAVNAELLRADAIVSRIEEITDRVESTTRTVQGVANAPAEIVTDIADRVRRAWKRRQAESTAPDAEESESPSVVPTDTAPAQDDADETSST